MFVHAPLGVHATLVVLGWAISVAQLNNNFLRCSVQPNFLDEWTMEGWWGCSVTPFPEGLHECPGEMSPKSMSGSRTSLISPP